MMSLWDALRMNMMISYQELVRTFPSEIAEKIEYLRDNMEIRKKIRPTLSRNCKRKIQQRNCYR
ncbi:hypothetical protein A9R11_27120 [Klebsiella pneumoniae]|nr:hypothetical protein A9R11_27120 [Klebsiella pneumoniae]